MGEWFRLRMIVKRAYELFKNDEGYKKRHSERMAAINALKEEDERDEDRVYSECRRKAEEELN